MRRGVGTSLLRPLPLFAGLKPCATGDGVRKMSIRRTWPVLALVFVLSLPAVTARIYASDEIEYFAFLRSLWFDHDLSFDDEYRHFYESGVAHTELFRQTFLELTTATGHRENFGTIGCAILWTPFYAAADLGVRLAGGFGSPAAADGYSRPYVAAVAFGSAVYAFLALLLSLAAARRLFPGPMTPADRLVPVLAVWFGTPLAFYMYVAPPMPHAASAFAVATFIFVWLRVRDRWSPGGLTVLGALAALVAMVREQDAFFALGPALDLAWTVVRRARESARGERMAGRPLQLVAGVALGALAFAVVFLPQAIAYLVLNGRLGPSRLVTRKMTWTAPHAFQVLASPEHGYFFWTPLAVVAIAGLVLEAVRQQPDTEERVRRKAGAGRAPAASTRTAAKAVAQPGADRGDCMAAETKPVGGVATAALDRSWLAVCLLATVVAQAYLAGSVESWTVAGAFGQRRFVALTIVLVLGLTALSKAVRSRGRWALSAVIAFCVWWNLGLMLQFGSGLMDRQRLELGANAYNNLVVIPRELPRLAYRYLFDRSSFYDPR